MFITESESIPRFMTEGDEILRRYAMSDADFEVPDLARM